MKKEEGNVCTAGWNCMECESMNNETCRPRELENSLDVGSCLILTMFSAYFQSKPVESMEMLRVGK